MILLGKNFTYLKDANILTFFSVDLAAVHAVNNLPVLQTRKILLIGYLVS